MRHVMAAAGEKIQRICKTVYAEVKELIEDFHCFYVVLYDSSKSKMEFPFVIGDGRSINFESRAFQKNFLPDFAIDTKETIKWNRIEPSEEPVDIEFIYWPDYKALPVSVICSPMLTGDKALGALVIEKRRGQNGFTGSSKRVLDEIAQQTAISINRFRLREKMEVVHDVGVRLSEGIQLGEKEILELIKEHADRVMDTQNMYIALYEPDSSKPDIFDKIHPENSRVYGTIRFGLMYVDGKPKKMPVRKAEPGKYGRTEVILASREPILNKTRQESEAWYRLPGHENFLADEGSEEKESFAGWLGVPMISGGKAIGVIATYHKEKEYLYDKDDQQVLSMMASQAGTAIENSWLYQGLEEKITDRTKRIEAVHDIGVKLTEGIQLGEEKILSLIKDHADRVMDTDNMYIALYEPDPAMPDVFDPERPKNSRIHGVVRFGLMYIDGGERDMPARKAKPGRYGRTEAILASREPILHKTKEQSEAWYKLGGHFRHEEGMKGKELFAGWLGVPMISGGKVLGVIATYHREREYLYDENDQQVLMMMASQAAAAIRISRLIEELKNAQNRIAEYEGVVTRTSIAADFVHRMNNLAGTIPGWVSMINQELINLQNEQISGYLNNIDLEAKKLLKEAEKLNHPPEPEKIKIYDLLLRLTRQAKLQTAKTIKIELFCDRKIPEIFAVKSDLANALWYIMENGMDAMNMGGGELFICAEEIKTINQRYIKIDVCDTGVGISEEDRNAIFDPFRSTKTNHTGYGLWRAKSIIERMGGHISLKEDDSYSTKFQILLPISE